MKSLERGILLGTLVTALSSCAMMSPAPTPPVPVEIARFNPEVASAPRIKKQINRDRLKTALAKGRPGRVVPLLYGKETSPGYKEYRLFGVEEGGAYDILGLENADIIIAANGYILKSANKLPGFVALLPGQESATIDVRRGGRALRFVYDIRG